MYGLFGLYLEINGTILSSLLLDYVGFPNSISRMIDALDRSRRFAGILL